MRRSADDLRQELFQNEQWHMESFHIIYHQLEQDPRPFAVLHQQTLDGLREYHQLVKLACEYIAGTRNHMAAITLSRMVYEDTQAFWRSLTVLIHRDLSYNERYFDTMSLMQACLKASRAALTVAA